MRLTNCSKLFFGMFAAVLIASCSISTDLDATIEREVEATTLLKEKAQVPTKAENSDLIKVKEEIWLGDTSEIEYDGDPLPSYLESANGITLVSNRPITLYEIGDTINKITKLGVRYAPQMEEKVFSEGSANKPNMDNFNVDWTETDKIILNYQGPLSGLLDELATRFGIWWKFEDSEIHFYKYITRTFVLYTLPTKPNMSINIGGSASGGGGNSSVSLSSSIDVELWGNIENTIRSMIDSNAQLTMAPADGTFSLTATPNDIKKVAKYVNDTNRRLSRQVAISVKVLQVTVSDSDQYGLNINAALNNAGSVQKLALSGVTGISEVGENLSLAVASGDWSVNSFIQALSTQGTTTLLTSGTVTTMNNKPAPIQVTQKENYISEMTKTNSGTDGDNYDISVTTEEIEYGFTMEILPRILEHGRLMMLFNLSLSDLVEMEKVSFGKADEQQYIQNPKIEARGFTQEIAMVSGGTLILSGYERTSNATQKTGVGSAESSLLGGTATADKNRTMLVILLTPVVLDNPLSPESRVSMR